MVAGTDYGHNDIGSELAVHSAIRSRPDIADTSARNIVDTNARRLCGVPDTFRPAPEIKNIPAVFDLPHVHSASTGDRGALVTSPRQRPARLRSTTKSQAAAGARLPRYFRSGLRHLVIHVGPVGLPCSSSCFGYGAAYSVTTSPASPGPRQSHLSQESLSGPVQNLPAS